MLEKFRRFRDDVTESYDTEKNVIESITGVFVGNDLTNIGTAFHYVVEKGESDIIEPASLLFEKWGVKATEKQIKIFFDHAQNSKPFVPEVPCFKIFETRIGKLRIVGHCDILQGNNIRDTKCKFSSPKMIEYLESYQWRLYLSIFELNKFIYDVFEFSGHDGRDVSTFEIREHEPFECLRYEKMEEDIQTLINDFVDWVLFRNLTNNLTTI